MNEQPATPTPAPEGAPGLSSGPVKGPSNAGPRTLAIDIGGTGLKASVLDDKGAMLVDRVRIPTTYPLAPQALIDALRTLVAPLPAYDRIAAGFPGMVRGGRVVSAPHFVTQDGPGTRVVPLLVAAWSGYDLASALEKELGKPARVANDADLQGGAVVKGEGLEVVITLGTGLGTAVYHDGHLTPHMNWLYEKSTGNSRQISLFEGMEYQVTDPFAIDFAVQHISLWGNQPDTQFVVGLTVNTGHLRRH